MAVVSRHLYPSGGDFYSRLMVDANVVATQFVLRSTATDSAGEVVDATTTGAADLMGVAANAVTYSATQADFMTQFEVEYGRSVQVVTQPLALYKLLVAGSATAGAALNSTAPANILTNTSASAGGTVVTAAEVGTVTFAGGLIIGVTGANAGQRRRISAHSNNTSTTVEAPFRYAIGVNDVFMRFPWSKAAQALQLTSDLTGANGIIVAGTGAPLAVFQFFPDIVNRALVIEVLALDHMYNPA